MSYDTPTAEVLRTFLGSIRTIAVVGLSHDPDRPSYSVAMYLQENGYRIIPVRPGGGEVLGEKVYERLADVPVQIDVVNLFRAPRFVAGHVDDAILARAPAIWMQEGVIDHEAARRAHEAGLFVVMDRCLLKEHRKAFAAG
jgi:predicted CoA-binding protein